MRSCAWPRIFAVGAGVGAIEPNGVHPVRLERMVVRECRGANVRSILERLSNCGLERGDIRRRIASGRQADFGSHDAVENEAGIGRS